MSAPATTTEIRLRPRDKLLGWMGTKSEPIPVVQAPARRGGLKTSKAVRDKIAASRAKPKVPIAVGVTLGTPVVLAAKHAYENYQNIFDGLFLFGREWLSYYTSIWIARDGSVQRRPGRWKVGTLPLTALVLDSKITKARAWANRQLGQMNVPIVRF